LMIAIALSRPGNASLGSGRTSFLLEKIMLIDIQVMFTRSLL
jgi:hypothetical protein